MSGGQWVAWITLFLTVIFFIGLLWYLFLGPGSSRWYKGKW